MRVSGIALDLSLPFLPEALAGLAMLSRLSSDDSRHLNQIRGANYLHVFDLFETCLADSARAQAARDVDARETLAPLLRLDAFDHNELFRRFESAFAESFPVSPQKLKRPADLDEVLDDAVPLSLLIVALHLKLVTQQHYLACVRADETLEPAFVRVLKDHWSTECGKKGDGNSSLAIQHALAAALPGRVPAALRDYRRIMFGCDDVLRRQAELDVATLETVRESKFVSGDRRAILTAQVAAYRKTFITFGIVNAAFVYAMRSLGPTAPASLAAVVSALASR